MSAISQLLYLKSDDLPKMPPGWRPARVQDISELLKPGKLYDENTVLPDGEVPVVNQSSDDWHGFHDEEPGVVASEDGPVSTFANHTCAMRLMKRPFSCIQNIFPRVGTRGVCDTVFFHYATLGRVSLSGYKGHHPIYREIWIPLPPLPIQLKIADILSAYDDLIENNRRRMALLEEAARQLYREWFVRLHFPGHEHTRITNGVPEGWTAGEVADFYDTASGGTPSRKRPDYFHGEIPWVKTQELLNGFIIETAERITEDGLNSSAAKLFPEQTVLLALYGATVGELGILATSATTNQACCAVLPKDSRAHYIHAFLFFRENKERLRSLSAGAAQKNISQEIIRAFGMVLPSKLVMNMFIESLNPAFDQWLNLERQNQKLRAARDLLLPRLMSGEIVV